MSTYYAAIGDQGLEIIYGIGASEEEAIQAALDASGYPSLEALRDAGHSGFHAERMTERFFREVEAHGYNGASDSWSYDSSGLVDFPQDDDDDEVEGR